MCSEDFECSASNRIRVEGAERIQEKFEWPVVVAALATGFRRDAHRFHSGSVRPEPSGNAGKEDEILAQLQSIARSSTNSKLSSIDQEVAFPQMSRERLGQVVGGHTAQVDDVLL